jgi:hypothetical protein
MLLEQRSIPTKDLCISLPGKPNYGRRCHQSHILQPRSGGRIKPTAQAVGAKEQVIEPQRGERAFAVRTQIRPHVPLVRFPEI